MAGGGSVESVRGSPRGALHRYQAERRLLRRDGGQGAGATRISIYVDCWWMYPPTMYLYQLLLHIAR
eukprot:1195613-Prorocentrum_minimum.AAC.2